MKVELNNYVTQTGNHLDSFIELVIEGVDKAPDSLELGDLSVYFSDLGAVDCFSFCLLNKPFLMEYHDSVLRLVAHKLYYLPLMVSH